MYPLVTARRFAFIALGWGFLACLASGPAHGTVILGLPIDKPSPLEPAELQVTEQAIRLDVEDRTLADVLQGIQTVSGIRLELATDLMSVRITTSIRATDWSQVFDRLLAGYNWMKISDERHSVERIIIGGREDAGALPPLAGSTIERSGARHAEPLVRGQVRSAEAGAASTSPVAPAHPADREPVDANLAPPGASSAHGFPFGPGPSQQASDGFDSSGSQSDMIGPPANANAQDFPPPPSATLPYEPGPPE